MGWIGRLFEKMDERNQRRQWERRQEKQRLQQAEKERAQREYNAMDRYAQWYMQGIREFLDNLEQEGFHPTGGFEAYPYIDYEKPFECFITKENDRSIFDFTDVRGFAWDSRSKRLLLYEISGNQYSAYQRGATSQDLVTYKLFDYASFVRATYSPFHKYEIRYDNSEAMATAVAAGIMDGVTGGRAGAYMVARSNPRPAVATHELLEEVQLYIETTEPGYEHILFQGRFSKNAYSAMFECNCSPVADTVFRDCFKGVFSQTPYYVESRVVNRKNGTKKDFMFGLGPYVSQRAIENNTKCFEPTAQLGVLSYFLEQFAAQINNSVRYH